MTEGNGHMETLDEAILVREIPSFELLERETLSSSLAISSDFCMG